mgnify:CR=1 FL=1
MAPRELPRCMALIIPVAIAFVAIANLTGHLVGRLYERTRGRIQMTIRSIAILMIASAAVAGLC